MSSAILQLMPLTIPCKHTNYQGGCRICYLAKYDSRYQKLWNISNPHTTNFSLREIDRVRESEQKSRELLISGYRNGESDVETKQISDKVLENSEEILDDSFQTVVDGTRIKKTTIHNRERWSYGVTTVPQRRRDLLPKTLASLKAAGFTTPRLFVDGDNDIFSWEMDFKLEVTCRYPTIRTYGNWILTLWELYVREPNATRYAIFQDDFITYKGLKNYLDSCKYPDKGYWNLYTFPQNQELAPKKTGWYLSNQCGRGAVALIFDNKTVQALLSSAHMVERPQHATRGHKAVDGGVVTALKKEGIQEYVHNPSLVQHTGKVSSMGNKEHRLATSFQGESFDAREMIEK